MISISGCDVATAGTKRIAGKWIVIPLVAVICVTVAVFLTIKLSGKGAAARNYLMLSFTQGLRDLDDGYYADAVKNLTPAVRADANPAAPGMRGEAYLRMKEYVEAEADFRTAVEREPAVPANQAGWGAALAGQGKHAEAIQHYEAALKLFTGDEAGHPVDRTGDTPAEVRELEAASRRAMSATE
jgi:tetratricopeptide (TPR) repeat protein